jgi:hypothetical protein
MDRFEDEQLSYTQMEIAPGEVLVGDEVFEGGEWVEVVANPFWPAGSADWWVPIIGGGYLICADGDTVEVRRGS